MADKELSVEDRLAALEFKIAALLAELGRHISLRLPEPPDAPEDHSEKTLAELKAHAQDKGIDLGGATTKAAVLGAIEAHEAPAT